MSNNNNTTTHTNKCVVNTYNILTVLECEGLLSTDVSSSKGSPLQDKGRECGSGSRVGIGLTLVK